MFTQAIIHYPKDEKIRRQIEKDIAVFHCNAALKYMDSLNLNNYQKSAVLKEALKSIRQSTPIDTTTEKG